MKEVTPLQAKIYRFIESYLEQNPFSPSLTEIASGIGISPSSVSLISRNIHALVELGRLNFYKKGYRNIQLGRSERDFALPIKGRIAAGVPIEAIEDSRVLEIESMLNKSDHFLLEVKGESMIEEGIFDGDFIICKQANAAAEGDIVIALIDQQEATLKRVSYQIRDRVTLIPANASLKPKAYLPNRVQIQGIFIGLLRLKEL